MQFSDPFSFWKGKLDTNLRSPRATSARRVRLYMRIWVDRAPLGPEKPVVTARCR